MLRKIALALLVFLAAICANAQDFRLIEKGIEYAAITRETEAGPIRGNLLRLDLKKVRLDAVHANDAAIGLEKTSSIAARHKAIAAINAGFFKMEGAFSGDPAGLLQINGKLLSESFGDRIAILIGNTPNSTKTDFRHIKTTHSMILDRRAEYPIGINRQPKANDIIIFTPEFGTTTATTQANIVEFILSKCMKACQRVAPGDIKKGTPIPEDGYVVRFDKELRKTLFSYFEGRRGGWIEITSTMREISAGKEKKLKDTEDIVAGVPQLIKNGKIAITWEQEKIGKEFVETKHPRTAVAKLKDGKLLLITIDGRQPGHSIGISLPDLAQMLLEMGATDAMNLDGGGSTTMYLQGKVMNKPSDKTGEREVSDAILVSLRK